MYMATSVNNKIFKLVFPHLLEKYLSNFLKYPAWAMNQGDITYYSADIKTSSSTCVNTSHSRKFK